MPEAITPVSPDAYSHFMVDLFDEKQVIGVSTGFQTFFGRPETGAKTVFSPDAATVDIDIVRGNEKLAALVHRGTNSRPLSTAQKNTRSQRYSNFSRIYPLIEEEGDIEANQLIRRRAGENPYEGRTRLTRMRQMSTDHHLEHIRRIVRLFEYLSVQSVLYGTMPAIFGTTNTDFIYDFRRNAANVVTLAVAWNNAAAAIMADIDEGCQVIRENGHVSPDMMVFGGETIEVFLRDDDIEALADNRRIELIEVSTNNPVPPKFDKFVEAGFIPRGRLRTARGFVLWLFTYIDGYTDASDNFQLYMPVDEVLIAYSGARCDRYFGPSETLPDVPQRQQLYQEMFGFSPMSAPMPDNIKNAGQNVDPRMFYFDAYAPSDWKQVTCRTQSAPIFATTMTDMFYTMQGVIEQ